MKEIRLCDSSSFEETIKKCQENNIGIEVQTFYDLMPKKGETRKNADKRIEEELLKEKGVLDKLAISKSMHGPYCEMNVGSKVPEIVAVAKKYYEKGYEIAKKLGCTEIVFHNGYFPGTSTEAKWTARAIDFWKKFLKDKDDSITICLENQFELRSDILKNVIDGVNDSRLRICLDIGHAHANSNMPVEQWIETLGDKIVYYHLHNNHGKQNIPGHNNDEHLGLNHGTIDIKKVLKYSEKYSPNAIWNLEAKVDYHLEDLKALESLGYKSVNQK